MYAPQPLETVRRFINTRDIDAGEDALVRVEGLADWAAQMGLARVGTRYRDNDLQRALIVREGLRTLLLANNSETLVEDAGSVHALDRAAEGIPLRVTFGDDRPDGLRPISERPIDDLLGHLLAIVATTSADGSWARLKACRSDSCQWGFYDRSRNHSGTWCSMSGCGNAAKQRAYASRRRSGGGGTHE